MATTTAYYPSTGEPQTIHFHIQGAQPTAEEAASLSAIPFEKTPPSAQEVKEALKWFCVGIGGAIFAWFFGRWVIDKFVGPGVLIFGFGLAYLGMPVSAIFGVGSLGKLFRSARKKDVKSAFRWLWMTSLLGEDAVSTRFGKPEYALSTLRRLIPAGVPFSEHKVMQYNGELRKTLADAADETTIPAKEQAPGGWVEAGPIKECTITEEKELHPNVVEIHASILYKDCLSRSTTDNKTYTMVTALLKLEIVQSFICAGGYWFPYEVTSPVVRTDKIECHDYLDANNTDMNI